MEVLISRHAAGEGPGYFAEFLDRHAIPYRVIKIDKNETLPASIAEFSGLVFMGGPMSVNDDLPWIPRALDLIRQAAAADKPVLGHCLGGQLISKALGGAVDANPVHEIGWFEVKATDTPEGRAWLNGLGSEFEVFHWHGETFTVPPGATRILENTTCANQGFVIGKTLALQCHVEMTAHMVRAWARIGAKAIARPSATIQSAAQMTAGLDERIQRLHRFADRLYLRWLQNLT
jgi:GMP synthase-like glutamine amidotransferase